MKRALFACLLAGCGMLDPEVGPEREEVAPVCAAGDSDPSTRVSFEQVRDVLFRPGCSCHTVAGGLGRVVGGLDLDDYDALRRGGAVSGADIVVPGDPCASVLVQKTLDPPPFGARMPFNGRRLQEGERQLIIDWIAEGASR